VPVIPLEIALGAEHESARLDVVANRTAGDNSVGAVNEDNPAAGA
jgi:hypothetical protein